MVPNGFNVAVSPFRGEIVAQDEELDTKDLKQWSARYVEGYKVLT